MVGWRKLQDPYIGIKEDIMVYAFEDFGKIQGLMCRVEEIPEQMHWGGGGRQVDKFQDPCVGRVGRFQGPCKGWYSQGP